MVLFDLVGDCDLELPREENSDADLYGLFSDAAQEGGGDASPFVGTTDGILDDHIPFAQAGIPSVGLIDFQFGPGPTPGAFWHTLQDDLDHVCAPKPRRRRRGGAGRDPADSVRRLPPEPAYCRIAPNAQSTL